MKPSKTLPPEYQPAGAVTLQSLSDMKAMLVWSIVLLALAAMAVIAVVTAVSGSANDLVFHFTVRSLRDALLVIAALLAVSVVMIVLHEGLHGLVFWAITHEPPKFAFKWYYASASAPGWYLPCAPFMVATLIPLVVITLVGLALLPFCTPLIQYLLALLVIFNASGCAGDLVVALRLSRLPGETLALDQGDQVHFFSPGQ